MDALTELQTLVTDLTTVVEGEEVILGDLVTEVDTMIAGLQGLGLTPAQIDTVVAPLQAKVTELQGKLTDAKAKYAPPPQP